MNRLRLRLAALAVPLLVTIGAFGLWGATGRDAYTKFTVVERVEVPAEEQSDDLFAAAGLEEEGETVYETRRRDEFRFGLLPTPQGLFDKHIFSVATVVVPLWAAGLGLFFLLRQNVRSRPPTGA